MFTENPQASAERCQAILGRYIGHHLLLRVIVCKHAEHVINIHCAGGHL